MHSLQYRLGGGLFISLIILLGIQWLLVTGTIRYLLEEYILHELDREGEAVLAAVAFTIEGRLIVDSSRLQSAYSQPFFGHYFEVFYQGGVYRSRSLWDLTLIPTVLGAGAYTYGYEDGPANQHLLVSRRGYHKQAHQLTIVVAEDISGLQQDIARFQWRYGMVSIAVMITLVLLQAWVVHRSLRPVDAARRQLQELERGEISALSADVPREIAPLILEINRLLLAMRQRMQRSRKSLGNLAHGLKTPISVLQQLLANDKLSADTQLRRDMGVNLDKIRQLTERELKRARLAGADVYVKHYPVAAEIQGLIDTLLAIYRDKNLRVEQDLDAQLHVNVDREDLLELLGNLLDNACKWAAHQVRISMHKGATLVMTIEDDGPGVTAHDFQTLVQRGARLDERTSGHGLGLDIVHDVVQSYHGDLEFSASPALGGLQVKIILPT